MNGRAARQAASTAPTENSVGVCAAPTRVRIAARNASWPPREGSVVPGREQRLGEQAVAFAVVRRLEVLASGQEDDAGDGLYRLRCSDRRLPRCILIRVKPWNLGRHRRCAQGPSGGVAR